MAKTTRVPIKSGEGGNYFASPKATVNFLSTGCKMLDLALGGGLVRGRVANIVGDKSTGKTLHCIELAANFAQDVPKGTIHYREAEAAFDKPYAANLGLPLHRVDFGEHQPETVEDFFEDLDRVIAQAEKDKQPQLVILDSLDALSDRDEMDRDMDKGSYGAAKAKKMSELFRRKVRKLEELDITLIIVSQVRDKMNVAFGKKTTRSGGRALDFYCTHVIEIAHIGRILKTVMGQKRAIGVDIKAQITKNKIGLPFREAEYSIMFGYGTDDVQACVDWLAAIKKLDLADIKVAEAKTYSAKVMEFHEKDFRAEVARLHKLCDELWWKMEKQLMPTRKKYG